MEMPNFCYQTAYFVLPHLLFSDSARFIGYFTKNEYPSGPYLFALASSALEREGTREEVWSFKTHIVPLRKGIDGYLLQYPVPPPFDLRSGKTVLAPCFSAVVHRPTTDEVDYYILGQNPLQGTTFRNVTLESNANLGPGPEPELEAFVAFLKERLKD